jgi:hypothetical protein
MEGGRVARPGLAVVAAGILARSQAKRNRDTRRSSSDAGSKERRNSLTRLLDKDKTTSDGAQQPASDVEFPMYVLSLATLLSEKQMRPHEEMKAAGKMLEWDESMKGHTIVSRTPRSCAGIFGAMV